MSGTPSARRAGAGRLRSIATTIAVALTLALAGIAGCDGGGESERPSVKEWLEGTHIYGQDRIKIGVATFEPLMGVLENGAYSGFDTEIARYIAGSLGYGDDQNIEFVSLATEDRIPALQGGDVDIVVASFSMTEERAKLVSFAGPYLITTQEVLVPTALRNDIRTLEDLQDPQHRVCVSGGSTTEEELKRRNINPLVVKTVRECLEGLRSGDYQAMSSDETILAGFLSEYPSEFEIVDMPFGTSEQLGVGVPITDPKLRDLVAYFLNKSYQAGRDGDSSPWLVAYNRTLGPWLGPDKVQPPPLNVPDLVDYNDKAPQG